MQVSEKAEDAVLHVQDSRERAPARQPQRPVLQSDLLSILSDLLDIVIPKWRLGLTIKVSLLVTSCFIRDILPESVGASCKCFL